MLNDIARSAALGLGFQTDSLLRTLPTEKELFVELIDKLKDKPVGKTLSKIMHEQEVDTASKLKAWSSVLTHVAIELEHGNTEFKMLVPRVFEKVSAIIGEL